MQYRFGLLSSSAAAATALALTLVGCSRDKGAPEAAKSAQRAAVDAQPANADPCSWLSAADAEQLLGKLEGAPHRGRTAESPDPEADGRACVYTLADKSGVLGGTGEVAVEIEMKDPTSYETGSSMAMEALARDVGGILGGNGGKSAAKADSSGWDYTGGIPSMWVGRVGHMAVQIGFRIYNLPEEKIERFAAAVRDRVPDRPVAAPGGDPNASGGSPDPCSLLTRAEVEAIAGKLTIDPYRSRESTPLADGRGASCSYYRGKHRVLVLTPTWRDGKENFRMSAGVNQKITSVLGGANQSADTLDGPWDEAAAGLDGELFFLKGDKMLGVQYRIAGLDQATATRLAAMAVKRL